MPNNSPCFPRTGLCSKPLQLRRGGQRKGRSLMQHALERFRIDRLPPQPQKERSRLILDAYFWFESIFTTEPEQFAVHRVLRYAWSRFSGLANVLNAYRSYQKAPKAFL